VTVRTATGRRDVYLGAYNSPESKTAYARVLAESAVGPIAHRGSDITVDELILAYMKHVEGHYRAAYGTPSKEQDEIKRSLGPVHKLYGMTPAANFGPKALATIRNEMIALDWCRTLVNRRVGRVVRAFKWAASQELVPVTVFAALRTVPGLQKGRTQARESESVKPVSAEHVAATLPRLNRHVRAMVELQQLTGMRPGEVCGLTLAQVDRTAEPWVYAPTSHKGTWRGKPRAIPFGPKARALIIYFLVNGNTPPAGFEGIDPNDPKQRATRLAMADAYAAAGRDRDADVLRDVARAVSVVGGCVVDPAAPVFSPARERAERSARLRAARKSKVQPSQLARRANKPKRVPGVKYNPGSYAHAIRVAAEKAGVPHWHPNQVRHSVATDVRRRFGLEAAGAALGHSRMSATEVYAQRDAALAARVAEAVG
jgi:integrase